MNRSARTLLILGAFLSASLSPAFGHGPDQAKHRIIAADAFGSFRAGGNDLGQALSAAAIVQAYYFAFDEFLGLDRSRP